MQFTTEHETKHFDSDVVLRGGGFDGRAANFRGRGLYGHAEAAEWQMARSRSESAEAAGGEARQKIQRHGRSAFRCGDAFRWERFFKVGRAKGRKEKSERRSALEAGEWLHGNHFDGRHSHEG